MVVWQDCTLLIGGCVTRMLQFSFFGEACFKMHPYTYSWPPWMEDTSLQPSLWLLEHHEEGSTDESSIPWLLEVLNCRCRFPIYQPTIIKNKPLFRVLWTRLAENQAYRLLSSSCCMCSETRAIVLKNVVLAVWDFIRSSNSPNVRRWSNDFISGHWERRGWF